MVVKTRSMRDASAVAKVTAFWAATRGAGALAPAACHGGLRAGASHSEPGVGMQPSRTREAVAIRAAWVFMN